MGKALMHADGCHFYLWVSERDDGQTVVTFDERKGQDLSLHRREPDEEPCERCEALSRGAKPRHEVIEIAPLPSDPMEALVAIFDAVPA